MNRKSRQIDHEAGGHADTNVVSAVPLTIDLFGPLRVSAGNRVLTLPARKDRALLALLATERGRSVARSRLAGLLWGEKSEAHARDSLKQALVRLRRLLSEAGAEGLVVSREGVALSPKARVDIAALKDTETAIGAETLADLRRGPFLDGTDLAETAFQDWLLAERAQVDDLYALRLSAALRKAQEGGRATLVARLARALISVEPMDEEAERALMRVHAARGERRVALQRFEALRRRLSEEFGVTPEPATTALADRLREAPLVAAPARNDAPEADGSVTVLVMPFLSAAGAGRSDYLAEGLSEDIATDLGRLGSLRVIWRPARATLHETATDAIVGARALGATHVLEGSVRTDGTSVRVTVRLHDAADGRQIWAERFDRQMTDVFQLQNELSRSVVSVLGGTLVPDQVGGGRRGTRNVEAYTLYLKARSLYLRGLDPHGISAALKLLRRAVECDPDYAEAHALVATCEFYLVDRVVLPGRQGDVPVASAAHRAVALAPDLPEARAALGLAHYAAGDYDAAGRALSAAAKAGPDLFEPQFFLARNMRLTGDRAGAARLYEKAAAIRSEDYRSAGLWAEELAASGNAAAAREASVEALSRLERAVERHPENADALAYGAAVLAELGDTARAQEWARWAELLVGDTGLVQQNYNLARAHALLGDRDAAIGFLSRVAQGDDIVRRRLALWVAQDHVLAALAADPRVGLVSSGP